MDVVTTSEVKLAGAVVTVLPEASVVVMLTAEVRVVSVVRDVADAAAEEGGTVTVDVLGRQRQDLQRLVKPVSVRGSLTSCLPGLTARNSPLRSTPRNSRRLSSTAGR